MSARQAILDRRARGGRAFVPFLTAGYPDWERFDRAVLTLAEAGADVLELGVPFSDPLADGATIQASSQRALDRGVTLAEILRRVEERRSAWQLPVVLMSYANPVLALGAESFSARAKAAGVAGVLLSDLPPEELPELWGSIRRAGLETVFLVAPTTTPERVAHLAEAASGYVYLVTRTGVTGQGGQYAQNLDAQIRSIRQAGTSPVIAGFGIRSAEDARRLGEGIDGVVVGARLIEILAEDAAGGAPAGELRRFAESMRTELDRVGPEGS